MKHRTLPDPLQQAVCDFFTANATRLRKEQRSVAAGGSWAAANYLYGPRRPGGRCVRRGAVPRVAEETNMAKTLLGMSKRSLVQVMGGSAALFGVTGVLAPGALGATYGVPASPHATHLIRLFGSRMLALAAWSFTARTREETDRALAVATAVCLLDTLTALTAARGLGSATAVRAAGTSAFFGTLGFAVRSLDD